MGRVRWASLVRKVHRRAATTVRRKSGLRGQLELRPDPAEPLVERVSTELGTGELDRGHQLAELAWQRRPDHLQLQDLLVASLDRRGDVARALALSVDNARRRIGWLQRQRGTGRPPRQLGPQQRILFAGFYRSGSSTVLDYLRRVPGAARWTTTGEMRLLKAPGGIADLASRHQQQGGLTESDLVDFYLHLTGWKLTRHPPGTFDSRDVVNRHATVLFRNPHAFGYLQTCLESFLELVDLTSAANPTAAELVRFFRDAVGRALDVVATDTQADVLLIDQAINAWRLPLSRFLPPSTFVIVHRDPRDQFVDVRKRQQQPGLISPTAESFVREYRLRRTGADRDLTTITTQYGHHTYRVGFEDFVLDHERQARQLTDALALSPPGDGRSHYNPRRARNGIGQHARQVDPCELAILATSLPEYLDHRSTSTIPA